MIKHSKKYCASFLTGFVSLFLLNSLMAAQAFPDEKFFEDAEQAISLSSASNTKQQSGPADIANTSLAEMGFKKGYTFDGLQSNHGKTFFFPLPTAAKALSGELFIDYQPSPGMDSHSMIRVDINGTPAKAQNLSSDGGANRLRIKLNRKQLRKDSFLNVTVRAALLVGGDRCLDNRLGVNFLHIQSTSRLALQLPASTSSIKGAWELLPKTVTISYGSMITEDHYRNLLILAKNLIDEGKQVHITKLPVLGDIIVADKNTLKQAVRTQYPSTWEAFHKRLPENTNTFLLNLPDKRSLVFSKPFEKTPVSFMQQPWRHLALAKRYGIHKAKTVRNDDFLFDRDDISLEKLGMDISTRQVQKSARWDLDLSPDILPATLLPDRLHLELVSTPATREDTYIFQVYLNGILQKVTQLPNEGQRWHLTVNLSRHNMKSTNNQITLIAQRDIINGNCQSQPPSHPVQLTPASYLHVVANDLKTRQFMDLRARFNQGITLYIPQPEGNIGPELLFLASLISHNKYPLDNTEVYFHSQHVKLEPKRAFIAIGNINMEFDDKPVVFDQGRVVVKASNGKTLLDVDSLPEVTVTQLVKANGFYGLSIMAYEDKLAPLQKPLLLENDSVAFSGRDGQILTLDNNAADVMSIEYPEYESWFTLLDRYRFWLLALGWLLLTLLVVHLYSKAREHQKMTSRDSL